MAHLVFGKLCRDWPLAQSAGTVFKKLMHGSLVVASPWAQTCTYVLSWTKVFFAVGNAESYDPHGQTRTCYPRISQGMAAAPYEF